MISTILFVKINKQKIKLITFQCRRLVFKWNKQIDNSADLVELSNANQLFSTRVLCKEFSS